MKKGSCLNFFELNIKQNLKLFNLTNNTIFKLLLSVLKIMLLMYTNYYIGYIIYFSNIIVLKLIINKVSYMKYYWF